VQQRVGVRQIARRAHLDGVRSTAGHHVGRLDGRRQSDRVGVGAGVDPQRPVGARQTVCLDRPLWEWQNNGVVVVKQIASSTRMIDSACYEPLENKTRLTLMRTMEGVEIEL